MQQSEARQQPEKRAEFKRAPLSRLNENGDAQGKKRKAIEKKDQYHMAAEKMGETGHIINKKKNSTQWWLISLCRLMLSFLKKKRNFLRHFE